MEILHVSAECYPVAKVGGLADVAGALPKYQKKLGVEASVIMPFYSNDFAKKKSVESVYNAHIKLGDLHYDFEVLRLKSRLGFPLFMVRIIGLLDRPEVYGYDDDTERFLAFQIAVLDWMLSLENKPDIVHTHDHHTGFIAFMMAHGKKYKELAGIPTILSIHNAQYQGQFGYDELRYFPEFDLEKIGLIDWYGSINPLATAIKCSWRVNTVSPSYMEELKQESLGLEGLLRHESEKCLGILNGIDDKVWDPAIDQMLVKNFSVNTAQSGKKANKKALCDQFHLDPEKPLFAFIGRLVYEKGADLFPEIFYKALLDKDINILVLGSGDPQVESGLKSLLVPFKGHYNAFIGYNEQLAHQIYGGADFLLMPSRVEPCGLNQMYAMRYGTIPIVRRIGGLKDTVIDIGDGGTGICHDQSSVFDVVYSIGRAKELYRDQKSFKKARKAGMEIDNSWEKSAQDYLTLYKSLIN